MRRLKPTKKLDIIGDFALKPEKVVGDYFESKLQKKYYSKPPNWDSPGAPTVELLAIENAREHQAMLKMQEELLETQKIQRDANSMHIRDLYQMQQELKEKFVKCNEFMKSCSEKKINALKQIENESSVQRTLKENIANFKKNVIELEQFRIMLKNTCEELEPYEQVIEEVVEKSDIMTSVRDCMMRCDALLISKTEINSLQEEKLREIENMRKQMIKNTEDVSFLVLGLKNDLSVLERTYRTAQAECLRWEKTIATAKNIILERELTKEQISTAIREMYNLLCKRRGLEPSLQRSQYEKQLQFIKNEFDIIKAVLKEFGKL